MSSTTKRELRGKPPHPTATALLEAAVELLETLPMESLSIAMVLERTGVSHGSLYHHFDDFPDLVEKAVVHRYTRRLKESLHAIEALRECTNVQEFRGRIEQLISATTDISRRRNRMDRVEVLGALHGHPRLVDSIARAQQEITDAQGDVFREFQGRGWLRSDLDPIAMSAFIQAMVVGRIVDDVSAHPVDQKTWEQVAMPAFIAVLFGS
ncbi:MAG: TetR/AcrR family transcriptional regulator [Actinomycetota bacterium]